MCEPDLYWCMLLLSRSLCLSLSVFLCLPLFLSISVSLSLCLSLCVSDIHPVIWLLCRWELNSLVPPFLPVGLIHDCISCMLHLVLNMHWLWRSVVYLWRRAVIGSYTLEGQLPSRLCVSLLSVGSKSMSVAAWLRHDEIVLLRRRLWRRVYVMCWGGVCGDRSLWNL